MHMARPKPTLLLEFINRKSNTIDQIINADCIWAVFYKDSPINIKSGSLSGDIKYKRFCFANSGHALNLAKKLNTQFKCSDFSVYKLTGGTKIY